MLSVKKTVNEASRGCGEQGRTDHFALLVHKRAQISEYFVQFVNAGLNFANFGFALLDEALLVS
jgi:hypothetical protein